MWSCVVSRIDRMVNDGSRHKLDYSTPWSTAARAFGPRRGFELFRQHSTNRIHLLPVHIRCLKLNPQHHHPESKAYVEQNARFLNLSYSGQFPHSGKSILRSGCRGTWGMTFALRRVLLSVQ